MRNPDSLYVRTIDEWTTRERHAEIVALGDQFFLDTPLEIKLADKNIYSLSGYTLYNKN